MVEPEIERIKEQVEEHEKEQEEKIEEKEGRRENNHVLVRRYLKEYSLVESNLASYNAFIEHRVQNIIDSINEDISKDEVELNLGKIKIGKPIIVEADGSSHKILPIEAKLRKITYSAPVTLEISTGLDRKEFNNVEIGRIPIMVKSKRCNLYGMNKEELIEKYEDPNDTGGYFIINGNERVLVMIEDLAPNQPFIEKTTKGNLLRLFSQRGSYRIPVSITETGEGEILVSFSRFKNLPSLLLIKALGVDRDEDIAKLIEKETDSFIVNLYEHAHIQDSKDALINLAEKMNIHGTQKEVLDRVKARIDSALLPHIGTKQQARYEKAVTLCKLIKYFLVMTKEIKKFSDKDHYANKRVRLSGDLLFDLFRLNLTIFIRDLQHSLRKIAKKKKFYSLKSLAKSTLFSHRIESAIATGSWVGERTGTTQNMDKTNRLSILSQLQRVVSLLPSEQENFKARTLHPTHFGRFCPIETPEGTPIGLRKNLALLSRVTTLCEVNEKNFVSMLIDLGLKKEITSGIVDVFYNGKYIGGVQDANDFLSKFKENRRGGKISYDISIRHDKTTNIITISGEAGRVLRPLLVVKEGKSLFTQEHINAIEKSEIGWNDLMTKGIIEYLDAAEEDNCLVAMTPKEITQDHTHVEIDSISMLGLITGLVPFANYDGASRLNRGSKTQKQSLGIYAANFQSLIDTDVSILHYPQKPIVRSFLYDATNFYPAGQNLVVAILPYEGYNLSDALVLNKSSLERGLGRSTYFRPYTSVALRYTGNLKDEICIPTKDITGYRIEKSYRFLEDDGIVYPEAELREEDVAIGKISPPKFLLEMEEISLAKSKKENSTVMRQGEKGTIDAVFITIDSEGNKIIQVRTRDYRSPEPGDKFSTTHGQKGVVGFIAPEQDIPFTSKGIRPDLIFNPHGIPSRMTISYLIELLAGKVGCLSGKSVDATAFSGQAVDDLEKQLLELGFRADGKETLYDGLTGKPLEAKIFIGNMYYLKLKYMVANKIQMRSSGKVTLLTRQPVEGRAKGGALRLGEMEKDALVAHGASLLLKERFGSDNVIAHVCPQCGSIGIKDKIRKREVCPICGQVNLEPIEISYASKLLLEELSALHIFPHLILKNKYDQ
jgi:DNA-directed RNA polymerase subunit B